MTNTVASVERSYRILHSLKDMDGARVSELAAELDMTSSTIHKHLKTLLEIGYVTNEGGTYNVGLRYLNLGGFARNRRQGYQEAIPLVHELAKATEERSQFHVEEHGRGIYLHTETPEHAVRTERYLGQLRYLHSGAAGKAILASLPKQYVEDIVDQWGLPAETEHTITDKDVLFEELEDIRDRGIAFNDEESIKGLRAVGVSVTLPSGQVLGAFSVAGPAHRLKGEFYTDEIPDLILGYANELELNLTY